MRKLLALAFSVSILSVHAQEISSRYELVNLGSKVNTGYHEGGPVISPDGKILYFFVTDHPKNHFGNKGTQDIWYTEKGKAGEWSPAQHLGSPLNNHQSNQVFSILDNGNTLLVRGGKGKNDKGFSMVSKRGGGWGDLQVLRVTDFKKMNLGRFYGAVMNTQKNVLLLYFSEKEKSTFSDIYVSFNEGGLNWSRPQKLPKNINTGRDEFGPFLASDDKTMYFASSRKDMGFGSTDIYKVERLDDTWLKWSDPVNLGPSVNTKSFDAYFSVDNNNNAFTTRSNRTIDGGNLDIYGLQHKDPELKLAGLVSDAESGDPVQATLEFGTKIRTPEKINSDYGDGTYAIILKSSGKYFIKITASGYKDKEEELDIAAIEEDSTIYKDFQLVPLVKKVLLAGVVYNKKTEDPIDSAEVVARIQGEDINAFHAATEAGKYEYETGDQGWYIFNVSAPGFLSLRDSIEIDAIENDLVYSKNFYLEPIEVGTTVRLENIFFDFDKTTLKQESFIELDKVVEFLEKNPNVEIEIAGHTDGKGSDDYNLNLSQGRAEAVVAYLADNGINGYRLEAKGYGETKPVATNDTEEGRAINRRVEFTVLKK
ncbi:MAG: OmpA family protein [Bacteroidota bacterium]